MNMEEKLELLKKWLAYFIDHREPITLKFQIQYWNKYGRMPKSHNGKNFMPFETWLKIYQ